MFAELTMDEMMAVNGGAKLSSRRKTKLAGSGTKVTAKQVATAVGIMKQAFDAGTKKTPLRLIDKKTIQDCMDELNSTPTSN